MFLISAILDGQDLENSLEQAKIAHKNRQLAYQWLKRGALTGYVPEEGQQQEKLHTWINKTFKNRELIFYLMQQKRLEEAKLEFSVTDDDDHSTVVAYEVYPRPCPLASLQN